MVGCVGRVGEPGIANWRSWVQFGAESVFGGLSQSREIDNGRMTDRMPRQQASRIQIWDFEPLGLTPPIQRGARTTNELQTLVGHEHTSEASDIAFCYYEL